MYQQAQRPGVQSHRPATHLNGLRAVEERIGEARTHAEQDGLPAATGRGEIEERHERMFADGSGGTEDHRRVLRGQDASIVA